MSNSLALSLYALAGIAVLAAFLAWGIHPSKWTRFAAAAATSAVAAAFIFQALEEEYRLKNDPKFDCGFTCGIDGSVLMFGFAMLFPLICALVGRVFYWFAIAPDGTIKK